MFSVVLLIASILAAPASGPAQPAEPPALEVKGAGSRGTLVFTAEGVAFRAVDPKKSRHWPYRELKQVRIVSSRTVALDTYQDGSRWRLGADRSVQFTLTQGAIDGTLVTHLLEHAGRPVSSAVLPAGLGEPAFRIDAKHLRGRQGTHGAVAIYPSGLAYETTAEGGSRYWRFTDVESILRISPNRLLIDTYERGRVRPFAFELKEPLPDAAFEALWRQVNPATTRTTVGLPADARTDITRATGGLPADARTDITRATVGGGR